MAHKFIPQCLTGAILIACIEGTIYPTNEQNNYILPVIGIGIAGAGIAAWKLWPSSSDTQTILDNAQTLHNQISQNHAKTLEKLGNPEISESTLTLCASEGIHNNMRSIESSISLLVLPIKNLEKAIKKTKDADAQHLLKAQLQQLTTLQHRLRIVNANVEKHRPYFSLFEQKAAIASQYSKEIAYVNQHQSTLTDKMRPDEYATFNALLNLCYGSSESGQRYPFFTCVLQTSCGINELNKAIGNAAAYPNLTQQASIMRNKLSTLHTFALNNPEYLKNLAEQKKDNYTQAQLAEQKTHNTNLENIAREKGKAEHERLLIEKNREQIERERLKFETDRVTKLEKAQKDTNTGIDNMQERVKILESQFRTLQQRTETALYPTLDQLATHINNLHSQLSALEKKEQNPPAYESLAEQKPPAYQEGK